MTKIQKQNLLKLAELLWDMPEGVFIEDPKTDAKAKFDMSTYDRYTHSCGTLRCALGWAPRATGVNIYEGYNGNWLRYAEEVYAYDCKDWKVCSYTKGGFNKPKRKP